ncbi:MAG: hypothetical protein GYA21_19445 [Myxococcales bacterium]|nr:hypothetical protein [Myxococcales bacterium]
MREDILRRNRDFLARGKGPRLPEPGTQPRLLVVSCSCPELNGVLNAALGLMPGEAFFVRLAGAWGGRQAREMLRSVAVALEYLDFPSVLVVGHEPCRCLEASSVQARRVLSRVARGDADGDEPPVDVEGWPATPAEAVVETVRRLRPLLPASQGGEVLGAMLELPSGRIHFLSDDSPDGGENAQEARAEADAEQESESKPIAEVDLPPLPPLPDIPLPEIPEVSVEAPVPAEAPGKPKKPVFAYGQVPGAGPVAMVAFQAPVAEKVLVKKAPPGKAALEAAPAARATQPAARVRVAPQSKPTFPQASPVPKSTKSGETYASDLLSALPQIKRVMWQNLPMEHIQSIRRDVRSAIDANRSSEEIVKTFVSGLSPLGQKRQLIRSELNLLTDVLAGTEEEFVASVMEGLLD